MLSLAGCSYVPSWMGGEKKVFTPLEGERLAVMKSATQLEADPSLAVAPWAAPEPVANSTWPQHGGNAQSYPGQVALGALTNQQSVAAGEGEEFEYRLIVTPVVAEGMVFAMDAQGHISAHDARNVSQIRWSSAGVASEDDEPVLGGGLAYDQGRLYASSGKGLMVALDAATGTEQWRQPLNIPIRSAPRIDGGKVYAVTVDRQLYALDAKSGVVLWSHRGINEGRGFLIEATPAAIGEVVVAPYSSGEIYVLHSDDGTEIWSDMVVGPQRQLAASVFTGIGGDPVIADGMLYVAGSAGSFAVFQLETGRRLWEQPFSSVNTPYVAGEDVFVLTSDNTLMALNRMDGRVRWVQQLPIYEHEESKEGRYTWSGPVLAGGRLLVAGGHGVMLEIAPQNGAVLAQTEIPSGVYTAPVVAGGMAYVMTSDARLHTLY